MDPNAQFPSWTTHDFLLNVDAVHELKNILCGSSNIVSVAFMLSGNASHTHETVPNGFYFALAGNPGDFKLAAQLLLFAFTYLWVAWN